MDRNLCKSSSAVATTGINESIELIKGTTRESEKDTYLVTVVAECEVQLEIEANTQEEAEAKSYEWRNYDYQWPFKSNGYHESENNKWVSEEFEIEADIHACHIVDVISISKVVERDTGETELC